MNPNHRRARLLEARATRLWNLRLFPGAPEYALADNLWSEAQALRARKP